MNFDTNKFYSAFNRQDDEATLREMLSLLVPTPDRDIGGYGYTPLHFAAKFGFVDIVDALIESGAKVNARTVGGQGDQVNVTPLWAACEGAGNGKAAKRPWHYEEPGQKVIKGDTLGVAHMLLAAGADPNATAGVVRMHGRGESCLSVASQADNMEVVELLLGFGADPQGGPPGANGMNYIRPLFAAVFNGNTKMVKLLLDAGADPDLPSQNYLGRYRPGDPLLKTTRELAASSSDEAMKELFIAKQNSSQSGIAAK